MSEWAEHWRLLLEDAPGDVPRRSRRGWALVRSSRVNDVRVATGRLSGSVQGSRATPYVVEITLPVLSDEQWTAVAGLVAAQVRHSARLLAGQAPDGLDAELRASGVRLLPRLDEIEVQCVCGEGLCAHAAAVWHAVGELIEDDPFVMLLARGRGRQRLLDDVGVRRGSTSDSPAVGGIDCADLGTAGWWELRESLPGVPAAKGPRTPAPALRALGDPQGWAGGVSAYDLFRPLVERAAQWASSTLDDAASPRVDSET